MRASEAPQATGIEVVATQPTKADRATLAMFESTERKTLPGSAYIVKVRLKTLPEPTSRGFANGVMTFHPGLAGSPSTRFVDSSGTGPDGSTPVTAWFRSRRRSPFRTAPATQAR